MAADLSNVKVGDTLALPNRKTISIGSHLLLVVERITATQVCCRNRAGGSGEWRFRKSDGKEIGKKYSYVEIATPELIESVNEQRNQEVRKYKARMAINDLGYAAISELSLLQLEALAKAWAEIKELGK